MIVRLYLAIRTALPLCTPSRHGHYCSAIRLFYEVHPRTFNLSQSGTFATAACGLRGSAAGGGESDRSSWADTCVCTNEVRCKCLVSTRGMKRAKRIAPAGACKRATARSAALSESQWQRSKKSRKAKARRFFRAPQQDTNNSQTPCLLSHF